MKKAKFNEKTLAAGYRGMAIMPNTRKAYNRVMVGIPTTGNVRMEWVMARFGQVIPCNWSQTDSLQWLDQYSPIDFMVADARNVVVHAFLEQGFEWLMFIDHDTIIPPYTILRMNERMIKGDVPCWSGLYFTKSKPSEPLVYRGRGTGYYKDWEIGDQVWTDCVPMGCTMIHNSILKEMAKISETYEVRPGLVVKKVFETPAKVWFDPEMRNWYTATGTEDMEFCSKVMEHDIFKKAGWPKIARKKYPFLVDTNLFCWHIDESGVKYPANGEEQEFMR
jgi:hypothetical protein